MYMQIRLPLVCLLILVYCGIFYSRKKKLHTRTSNVFGCLTVVAGIHLLAAAVTEYTVNNRDVVPKAFNYVWHIVFLVSVTCACSMVLFYMIVYVERTTGRRLQKLKYAMYTFNMGGCALELFLPITYVDTPYGSYSLGPKAYVLYVVLAFVIVSMIGLLLRFRKALGQGRSKVLFATAFVFILVSVIQVIWPHILLTGPAVTAIVLGLMVNTEDAHLYVDFKTEFYNELGCAEILQEWLLTGRQVGAVAYVFLGNNDETFRAAKQIESAYRAGQNKYLFCGLFGNVLMIIPRLQYTGVPAPPQRMFVPGMDELPVKFGCREYVFSSADSSVEGIFEQVRDQKRQFEEDVLLQDELTGVLRRKAFVRQTEHLLEQKQSFAFLMLDLDNFKYINDTFGHHAGDAALKYAASVLKREVRPSDIVCRMGGDEFAVILYGVTDEKTVERVVSRMMDGLEKAEYPESHAHPIGVSAGVKLYQKSDGEVSFQELYAEADGALYRSKYNGKGCVTFSA